MVHAQCTLSIVITAIVTVMLTMPTPFTTCPLAHADKPTTASVPAQTTPQHGPLKKRSSSRNNHARPRKKHSANDKVAAGIAFYHDLEYEHAAATLANAVHSDALSPASRIKAYRHLLFCYVALGKQPLAIEAATRLLELDPGYQLPRTENPRAIDVLANVRRKRGPASHRTSPSRPALLLTATPSPAVEDLAITVSLATSHPPTSAQHFVLYHRVAGTQTYSRILPKRRGSDRFEAVISGTFVNAPGLEYYAALMNDRGKVVLREGSPKQPFFIVVNANATTASKAIHTSPLYKRWWVWTIGSAIAAGTGIALYSLREPDSSDAVVNIIVQ